ncbi:Acylphosphate phosphohydrolase [Serinibacter arcticus]|uniref:Acylphosphatase n=1 Tax=Serinibacter arcticus TaxID=1655435 RepID=A0A4Z1DYE6_9MICO|nr:Acylphosphate phosphohydrolase [Serinibacter arcticus]
MNVLVSGQVQGVGFRWSTCRAARELGVAGWVRNLPDGRVEAEVEGDRDAVDRAVAWLEHGPSTAAVTGTHVSEVPATGESGFDQR